MADENKIYRLMNEMKIETEAYESTEVSQSEKDKLFETLKSQTHPMSKTNSRNYWPEYVLVAIIFLLVLGSQTALGQSVYASAKSVIEEMRYSLSEALGNGEATSDTTLAFNQTAVIGGAEIRIEEMVAFDHRLVFNMLVNLDEPIDDQHFIDFNEMDITVNQEPIAASSATSQGFVVNETENIHSQVYTINLDEEFPLEDEMAVEIYVEDILYYNPSELNETGGPLPPIEGQAHFSAETTLVDLNQHTEHVEIGIPIHEGEYEYVVEEMHLHPVIQFIELSSTDPDVLKHDYQLMEIQGKDDAGNTVVFEPSYLTEMENERTYSFSLNEEHSEITSEELADAEMLELQLYLEDWPETDGEYVEVKPYGAPFKINLP